MIFTGWDRDSVGEGFPHGMYANVGGEWHEVKPLQELIETDLLPNDPWPPGIPMGGLSYLPDACNLTIRWSFRHRRMSRKRFIKLLMSRRLPRDFSTSLADSWHKVGVPYSSAWLYMVIFCFTNTY